MVTEVILKLKTRFEDEEQLDCFLEEAMENLAALSDERVVGYEISDFTEEDVELEETNHDPFKPGEELPF